MGMSMKDIVDLTLNGMNEKALEISNDMLTRYVHKETLNEISDNGKFETPLLFPGFMYLISAMGMCKSMQNEPLVRASTVIDYQLVYLHQTPKGAKELELLRNNPITYEVEVAAALYTSRRIGNMLKLLKNKAER